MCKENIDRNSDHLSTAEEDIRELKSRGTGQPTGNMVNADVVNMIN
jgi:hypothetical protein